MRFELSKSTPPHLNRRLQLRMLGFVGLIAVIMFMITMAQSKPPKNDVPLPGEPDRAVYEVNGGSKQELGDKEFISEPWTEPPALPDKMPNPDNDLEREIRNLETRFDKSILVRVKDNTLGIRREEGEAFFRLLDHVRHIPPKDLERSGATDVLYINLMTQPDRFRGEPITIHGDLWRLYEFEAGPNPYGLKTLYEAWIFTADSSTHPYRVVFTHLPKELEPGEDLRKPVKVTGYFFKREGYASTGGMHVAPTLLARQVTPFRPPNAAPSTDAIVPYMIGLVSAIGLAFLVTLVSFIISDRRAARAALLREMNAPRPSFEGIEAGPFVSVTESLKLLEDQEWQAEADAVDEPYEEVSTLLHARDRARTEKTLPVAPEPTVDELDDRRASAIKAVKDWTSQHGSQSETPPPVVAPTIESKPASQSIPEPAQEPATGESKLAAWESEIQQFADLRKPAKPLTPEQRMAQAELDRDERLREEELNERLRHERAVIDQEQADQETATRGQVERDRRTFSLPTRHEEEAHTPPPTDHLTIDRAEREDLSNDDDESSDEDESDDGGPGSNNKWSGHGRRSSRRQRRRDGR